ncbi:MAG: zinc ribbon domain-containing protein [Thermoplasmata archaeon]|nr:zinc ribbon domain-containing protein [Thermoplasmata archaeon]
MSTGFEGGAVYTPRFRVGGKPAAAPDEDTFTMAVEAVETFAAGEVPSETARVELVGEFAAVADWGLSAYLGKPVELGRHAGSAVGFAAALRAVESAPNEPSTLLIAAERAGPLGGQAAVLRFGPHRAPRAPEWSQPTDHDSAASLARAGLASIGLAPALPTGASPTPPWTPETAAAFDAVGSLQVSEGAYVPRPRYLENLPSRWRLEGDRCGRCDRVTFPRRARCRFCGLSDRLSTMTLPRDGARVIAATAIGKGGQPTEFDPQVGALGGYGVVLAEFDAGVRLTLQVTDAAPGEVKIGDRVGTRLRRLYPMEGEWRYGRKAVPLPE